MEDKKVLLLIGLDCPNPEKECEFNEWYEAHIEEILRERPGVKSATRYTLSDYQVAGPEGKHYPKYLTVWEFDSEEALRQYDSYRNNQKKSGQYEERTWKYEEKKAKPPTMLKETWRTAYTRMGTEKGDSR